jgi:hypothetical protein
MDVVRWEEPPKEHGNKRPAAPSRYQPIADALRSRPGEWAVVMDGKSPGSAGSFAYRVRNGVGPFAPAKHFDAKAIGPAGGSSSTVYARYVGDGTVAS